MQKAIEKVRAKRNKDFFAYRMEIKSTELIELRVTLKAVSSFAFITHTKRGTTYQDWFKDNEGWIIDELRRCVNTAEEDEQKEAEEESYEDYMKRKAKIGIDKRYITASVFCKDDPVATNWIVRPEFRFEANVVYLGLNYNMYWHNLA